MSDFNVEQFLTGLDAIFDRHAAAKEAGPYLEQAMVDAENAGDNAGLLTVLNETLGFYRSQGRHKDNQWIVQRTLELALRMGLEGSEAWATTLINCATAMRAAGCYDQAADLYGQALDCSVRVFGPNDRRVAALHNNLSMLRSETGDLAGARHELEQALSILTVSSPDPARDLDVASTHTNLALVLLEQAQADSAGSNVEAEKSRQAADHVQGNVSNVEAGLLDEAAQHAEEAVAIYDRDETLKHSAHYASALAGLAQVRYAQALYAEAVDFYERSLAIIEECYGTDTDYYRTTTANLDAARAKLAASPGMLSSDFDASGVSDHATTSATADDAAHPQSPTATAPGLPEERSAHSSANATVHRTVPSNRGQDPLGSAGTKQSGGLFRGQEQREALLRETGSCQIEGLTEGGTGGRGRREDTAARSATTASDSNGKATESGLELAKRYWLEYGKPMLQERYPSYAPRIAAGLVGHGSECYGFDDAISRDHDFGPRFCLWLTDEDYEAIGEQLQSDYEALPKTVFGFSADRERTPRAQGAGRRDGVFRIGDFFESITGYRQAPSADHPHEWLMLDEATLAAATNGQVFADPLGTFSAARQAFKDMPDDVRLSLISRRLGMMAQAGQYNFPRMIARGDGAGAWASLGEFADAASSLVFLFNSPMTVGYAPYYKWRFAALRRLSSRIATRMPGVCARLEDVMRLSSAACYGGAGFGEGGKGAAPAVEQINEAVEAIASEVVTELKRDGLTDSAETFLEWQRSHVEARITSSAPVLHSL